MHLLWQRWIWRQACVINEWISHRYHSEWKSSLLGKFQARKITFAKSYGQWSSALAHSLPCLCNTHILASQICLTTAQTSQGGSFLVTSWMEIKQRVLLLLEFFPSLCTPRFPSGELVLIPKAKLRLQTNTYVPDVIFWPCVCIWFSGGGICCNTLKSLIALIAGEGARGEAWERTTKALPRLLIYGKGTNLCEPFDRKDRT